MIFALILAAAAACTFTRPKEYSSAAQLYFRDLGLDQKLLGTSSFVNAPTTPATTQPPTWAWCQVPAVSVLAARELGVAPSTVEQDVNVLRLASPQAWSRLSPRPRAPPPRPASLMLWSLPSRLPPASRPLAADQRRNAGQGPVGQPVCKAPARESQLRQSSEPSQLRDPRGVADRQSTSYSSPAQFQTSPSKPNKSEYLVFGALLGLVLAILGALLRERLDRSVQDGSEVEALLQLPILVDIPNKRGLDRCLAVRPEAGGLARGAGGISHPPCPFALLQRRSAHPGGPGCLSAARGGQVNGGLASCQGGGGRRSQCLLVEADLHRPVLAARHGLRSMPGLAEALPLGGPDLSDAVQRVPVAAPQMGGEADTTHRPELSVLVAGLSAPNPPSCFYRATGWRLC